MCLRIFVYHSLHSVRLRTASSNGRDVLMKLLNEQTLDLYLVEYIGECFRLFDLARFGCIHDINESVCRVNKTTYFVLKTADSAVSGDIVVVVVLPGTITVCLFVLLFSMIAGNGRHENINFTSEYSESRLLGDIQIAEATGADYVLTYLLLSHSFIARVIVRSDCSLLMLLWLLCCGSDSRGFSCYDGIPMSRIMNTDDYCS